MVILAAVSGARHEDRVVAVGHDLAAAYGDELVVLHVMEQSQFEELAENDPDVEGALLHAVADVGGVQYFPDGQRASRYDVEVAMEDASRVARQCVDETLPSGQRGDVEPSGLVGDPAEEILAAAGRLDARFVVVGGRRRSPAGKAIFGSVSQAVVLGSDRPVVTITQQPED